MKRFQVDIKPCHQPIVRKLMKKLGDVSSADAIGFLIETQINNALARLEPEYTTPQSVAMSIQTATSDGNPPQNSISPRQVTASRNTMPHSEADDALSMLLGS